MANQFGAAGIAAAILLSTCNSAIFGQAERAPTSLKAELAFLSHLIGSWTGTTEGATPRRVEIVFREELSGHMIAGDYTSTYEGRPLRQVMLFTFDPVRREYRCAVVDNIYGLLDVYEGQRSRTRLVLSNERAATTGKVVYRFVLDAGDPDVALTTEVFLAGEGLGGGVKRHTAP